MKRKWIKRCTSIALTAAMVLSVPPGMQGTLETVQAAAIVKDVNLGTTGLVDPTRTADGAWTGSKVYFGLDTTSTIPKINGDTGAEETPDYTKSTANNLWRVLDASGGLLLADDIIAERRYDDDSNIWADSELKTWLNENYRTNSSKFSSLEQGAISADAEGDMRLLTKEEAKDASYGFSTEDEWDLGDAARTARAASTFWWLRSAGDIAYEVAYVDHVGALYSGGGSVLTEIGSVRPAFNLNLGPVLFSSASAASKSSFASVGDSNVSANTWKLTLKDASKTVAVTSDESVLQSGQTVTVPYTYTGSDVSQISIMITDKAYVESDAAILYYGALDTTLASVGTGTFTLPGSLPDGYKIYMMAEDVNDAMLTDYSSMPVEIVPALAPTPTYTVTAGAAGTHQLSTDGSLTITCDGDLTKLTGIYVDDNLVDATNYALQSGSTILTLNATYLNTLSAGTHRVRFQYNDGSAETTFAITEAAGQNGTTTPTNGTTGTTTPTTQGTVTGATTSSTQDATTASQKDDVPKTGDATQIVWLLMVVVLSGACVLYFGRKRKMGR